MLVEGKEIESLLGILLLEVPAWLTRHPAGLIRQESGLEALLHPSSSRL